ncbi:flavin reductase family protein [Embleya sp. NPDC008237]|uniref:flavin reductase family protein n=1 Tax=Embleya sp. NPDC008237 TaxID=3363978 RepID=UPI0036E1F645
MSAGSAGPEPTVGVADRPRPGGDRARELREMSRLLPTGVAVLTSAYRESAHGATVSTTTVLSQQPLRLGVCLRGGSPMTELIRRSGRFFVNVLSSRQALLADWFANPRRPAGLAQFDLVRSELDPGTDIPLLVDALAWFDCRLSDHIPLGGGEDLLVAEIVYARAGSGRPLIGFAGRLHDVEFHGVRRRQGWRADTTTTLD